VRIPGVATQAARYRAAASYKNAGAAVCIAFVTAIQSAKVAGYSFCTPTIYRMGRVPAGLTDPISFHAAVLSKDDVEQCADWSAFCEIEAASAASSRAAVRDGSAGSVGSSSRSIHSAGRTPDRAASTQQPRPAGSFWTARLNRARAAAAAAVDSDIAVVNTTLDTAPAARSSALHAVCASLAVPDEQVPTDQPIATSDLVMAPDPMADTPSTHVHADVAREAATLLSVNEGAAAPMPPDTTQDACNLDISIDEAWLAACTELP